MILYLLSIASSVLILDRVTKFIASSRLSVGQSIAVLPGIFHVTLVLNKGSAFGLLKDQRIFFITISIFAVSFILVYMFRHKAMGLVLSSALGLILGGAAGNLIDRIRFGYVIDFLDFRVWPVFNVADSCITIGTLILVSRIFYTAKT